MGFFSNLFSKQECSFCGNKVGVLSRDSLVNKGGYICKECQKKCSSLVKIGRFTKAQVEEHMKYMEDQNRIFKEAFESIDKKNIQRFMCVETGVEFANDIAMFRYISPNANKRPYTELFRYDQIKSYEPYMIENTNSQGGKKYSEVGVIIKLFTSWGVGNETNKGNRSYHPYVEEIKVPRHKNVDSYTSDPMIDYLDKLFGRYEDTSLVGGIKSSILGTNKQRQQMKVATEGLKALGNLAKAKMNGEEVDEDTINTFKDDAADLLTGNRATYTKIANDVENQVFNK